LSKQLLREEFLSTDMNPRVVSVLHFY
jgi:hypothetical protein